MNWIQARRETQLNNTLRFFNLHSFLDKSSNRYMNAKFLQIIERTDTKMRFNISFLFALIRERMRLLKQQYCFYRREQLVYLSDLDLKLMIEDVLNFLKEYPCDPFPFIEKYFVYIFEGTHKYYQLYNAEGFFALLISKFLHQFVFGDFDKQLIIDVKNAHYELFSTNLAQGKVL